MWNRTDGPNHKALCRLCEVLDCQPGELMEYVTEEELERRTREEKRLTARSRNCPLRKDTRERPPGLSCPN